MNRYFLLGFSSVALAAVVAVGTVFAQATASPRLVQSGDGTLYLIVGDVKYELDLSAISDDDLAGLQEGGPISGDEAIRRSFAPTPMPASIAPTPLRSFVSAVPTPTPSQQTVTVQGNATPSGGVQFNLAPGNYNVSWNATNIASPSLGDYRFDPTLYGPGGFQPVQIANVDIASGKQGSGQTTVNNVVACPNCASGALLYSIGGVNVQFFNWTMTFTPIP